MVVVQIIHVTFSLIISNFIVFKKLGTTINFVPLGSLWIERGSNRLLTKLISQVKHFVTLL